MIVDSEKLLDSIGWRILEELQHNGRLSFAELGRRVNLSLPAIAERVRRMEETGIITRLPRLRGRGKIEYGNLSLCSHAHVKGGVCPGRGSGYRVRRDPGVLPCHRQRLVHYESSRAVHRPIGSADRPINAVRIVLDLDCAVVPGGQACLRTRHDRRKIERIEENDMTP